MKTGNIYKFYTSLVVLLFFVLLLILTVSCRITNTQSTIQGNEVEENTPASGESKSADIGEIKKLVEDFGGVLANVSLLSPPDILENDMEKYYSPFVCKDLIYEWLDDPAKAPGRLTSSPWPDHIEIADIKIITDNKYKVSGNVVEVTSAEVLEGSFANKYGIILTVERISERWLITGSQKNIDSHI
jgi:hypothetical protein